MMERVLEPEVMDTWEDAVEYDEMDFRDVNDAFARRALELGPPHGSILDAGTGTARIPVLIAEKKAGLKITAIDLSANMLKIGSRHVANAGLADRITLQLVDAKQLPFPSGSFDMVISNSIVHHLPDPLPFLREVARVVRPGGGLLVRDLFRPMNESALSELVARVCANDDEHQRKLFRDSCKASFTVAEVRDLVKESGIEGSTVEQTSDRHWTLERPWMKRGS